MKYLLKADTFKKYSRYVDISSEYKELQKLWYSLKLLHEQSPGTDFSLDDLAVQVQASYPQMRLIEKESVADLIVKLENLEVKENVILDLVKKLASRGLARQIAIKALGVAEGNADFSTLVTLISESESGAPSTSWEENRCFVTDDLFALAEHTIKSPGLNWRIGSLRYSLGPIRPGDFGFVFARPETGKTTFLADQITYFAQQAERPIVWGIQF